jgi:hypothetical protein
MAFSTMSKLNAEGQQLDDSDADQQYWKRYSVVIKPMAVEPGHDVRPRVN